MKVLTFLACAGLTAAVLPAEAADLFGTAPPVSSPAAPGPMVYEVGSNWYLRGELGVSFDDTPTIAISSFATPPPGILSAPIAATGTGWSTTNFTGGVGAGYRFNDFLRFDATWDYSFGPGATRQTSVVCPYGLTGMNGKAKPHTPLGYLYNTADTCNATTTVRSHNNTFLANGYVDLGNYSGFSPYVGGGVGFNINSLSGSLNTYESANGLPYAANLTPSGAYPLIWLDPYGNPVAPQPSIAFAQQNWNRSINSTTYTFAWALMAGVGFQLNPSTTLDIGYRYLNTGAVNTLINPQTGLTIRRGGASQQVLVGIRYVLQ